MAARRVKTSPDGPPVPSPAGPAGDTSELELAALAEGILARTHRPRAADVRRLAEAVLEARRKPGEKKKKKNKPGKKPRGKKRKLSKIPGQGKKA